jgi:choline monooxygenase
MDTSKEILGNPLPIGYYFHPRFHQFREQLFAEGANYVGHELMVPESGDYCVLDTTNDQYILLWTDSGECVMFLNICRH